MFETNPIYRSAEEFAELNAKLLDPTNVTHVSCGFRLDYFNDVSSRNQDLSGDNPRKEAHFRALVSTYDQVNSHGFLIRPGAYTKTLARSYRSRDAKPINLWFSHKTYDLASLIGYFPQITDNEKGLVADGKLDIDPSEPTFSKEAARVYGLMKGRRLNEFSVGLTITEYVLHEWTKKEPWHMEALAVELNEISIVNRGSDPTTKIIDLSQSSMAKVSKDNKMDEKEVVALLESKIAEATKPFEDALTETKTAMEKLLETNAQLTAEIAKRDALDKVREDFKGFNLTDAQLSALAEGKVDASLVKEIVAANTVAPANNQSLSFDALPIPEYLRDNVASPDEGAPVADLSAAPVSSPVVEGDKDSDALDKAKFAELSARADRLAVK